MKRLEKLLVFTYTVIDNQRLLAPTAATAAAATVCIAVIDQHQQWLSDLVIALAQSC
jgi:hypothetical protein